MKQEIQEKLIRDTDNLTVQANVFSLVVETVETDLSVTMTFNGNNAFSIIDGDKNYTIQSNIDMYGGNGDVDVFVDKINESTGEYTRIADLIVHMNGNMAENYYNPTKADRRIIFNLFGDIEDAVDEFIDGGGTTPNDGEEE